MPITTNREYIAASVAPFGVSESVIDLIMLENPALEGALDVKACKLALYNKFSALLPVVNVSEGGYSISGNLEAVKLWYKQLCSEIGKRDVLKPQIRNRSNHW